MRMRRRRAIRAASGKMYYTNTLDAICDMLNRMNIHDGMYYMSASKVNRPRPGVRIEVETPLTDGISLYNQTFYVYIDDSGAITMVSEDDKARKFIDAEAVIDFFEDYFMEHDYYVGASSRTSRRRAIRAASMRDDFETSADIYTDDGRRIPVKIIDGWDKESKLKSQIENLYDELVSKFGEFWELSPNRHHPRAELLDQYIAELADLEGTSYEDVASRYLVQASTRVRANRKSRAIRAASGRKIPYDLVSTFVVLRDYADMNDYYVNKEHKLLCDIADALYNVGEVSVSRFGGEHRELYDEYGKAYFDKVLDDIYAIDSQLTFDNLNDLAADVNEMLKGW